MDSQVFFMQNMRVLEQTDPALAARLKEARSGPGFYRFVTARSGAVVPALSDSAETVRALHSTVDPDKEALRLIHDTDGEGCLVFLGLGGGFAPSAALKHGGVRRVLVIDYGMHGLVELFSAKTYTALLADSRFRLIVDEEPLSIERIIKETYTPALCGGLRLFPLRTRVAHDAPLFAMAAGAVQAALDTMRGDFSTQAFFGKRWFSNIIRNVLGLTDCRQPAAEISAATVCAAGPSLEHELDRLALRRAARFIIAVDTSLPVLLEAGIVPDAVISIDAQHISYRHFLAGFPVHAALYLDLAGSPVVAAQSGRPHFFSGSHPLSRYVSRFWRPLAELDTSGGNVGYAAVSLAEYLGAQSIELVGADFSYPKGKSYARGTYLSALFSQQQNRLMPLEASFSHLLYRSASLGKVVRGAAWYYETALLAGYRKALEQKIAAMETPVYPVAGAGAVIARPQRSRGRMPAAVQSRRSDGPSAHGSFCAGRALSAQDFLDSYRTELLALEPASSSVSAVLATILPTAAAFQRQEPSLYGTELIDMTRQWCVEKIEFLAALH
jgi:hypothetical protein